MSRRARVLLICILLLAAGVRLAYIAKTAGRPLGGDEPNYDSIAWNLVTGHGYKLHYEPERQYYTALRGPSYVLFLAGTYAVAGHRPTVPLALQALMDVLSCFLLFRIGLMIFRRIDVGLLGALFYAVYPPLIRASGSMLTETFIILSVLLSVQQFLVYAEKGPRRSLVFSAIAAGLGALSKPVLLLMPVLYYISAGKDLDRRRRVRDALLQFAVLILLFTPWTIRNALVFKAFVPGVSNSGFTFWGGVGPADGRVVGGLSQPHVPAYVHEAVDGKSEMEANRWFFKDAFRIIGENPGRYLALLPYKASRLWLQLSYDEPVTRRNIIFSICNIGLCLLAVFSLFTCRPLRRAARLLGALVIYFTVVHVFFFCVFRYSLPVYALMFPFAAAGIIAVLHRLQRGKTGVGADS